MGAAAESAAHDAGTGDTDFLCHIVEKIEFHTAHLVIPGETAVRLVHFAADGIVVSGPRASQTARTRSFSLNDKLGAGIILGRDIALHAVEHLHCRIAKGPGRDVLRHARSFRDACCRENP